MKRTLSALGAVGAGLAIALTSAAPAQAADATITLKSASGVLLAKAARPSKRLLKTSAAASVAALALIATAGSASANSFTQRVYQGTASYDDGADQFCLRADEVGINDRAVLEVTLRPDNTSRGPTITFSDIDYAGATCRSLATAYEDTHYVATIKSALHYDRINGTTWEVTKVGFYS